MKPRIYEIVEGGIVLALTLALASAACFSLVRWNAAISFTLITAYIVLAQDVLTSYFDNHDDDIMQSLVVVMATAGYIVLFSVSLYLWNTEIGSELAGGFVLFASKLIKGFFKPSPPGGGSPTTANTPATTTATGTITTP